MAEIKITKLHADRLLVKAREKQKQMESGLIIPDSVKERPEMGTVVAKSDLAISQIGDKIMFNKEAGVNMKLNGENVLMIRETDVYITYTEE